MTDVLELNLKAKPTSKWAEYVPQNVEPLFCKIDFVGSTFTCTPPPTDTDTDILCLVASKEHIISVLGALLTQGWEIDGDYGLSSHFTSYRKGNINLIVTKAPEFYELFIKARDVCKLLNIMDKKLRCKIHKIIMKEIE